MSPRRLIRDEAGFTVIEALVAAIVVAIGILGTATVISSADTTTLDSELQQVATDQGERALEQMRSLSYSELGHTGTPVLPSGESGLSGNNYTSPDASSSEQLVIAANTETGDTKYSSDCRTENADTGSATSCFKITPALQDKTFTVTQGGQTVSGHIYTFVTWHDEECELLPISSLKTQLNTLSTLVGNRLTQLSNVLNNSTYGLNSLLNAVLPSGAQNLKNALFQSGGQLASATALYTLLSTTQSQLDSLSSTLSGLTSLDLCDLKLSQFKSLTSITDFDSSGSLTLSSGLTTQLGDTGGTLSVDLTDLQSKLNAFKAAIGNLTSVLCPLAGSLICTPYNNLNASANTLTSAIGGSAGIYASTTTLNTDLANLAALSTANTTHNSKRVTVAVTIDKARGDLTPQNVTYLSTIVTNPDDGLVLTG